MQTEQELPLRRAPGAGMSRQHDACAAEALEEEATIGVVTAGVPVALFRIGGAVFALHDPCPHGAARPSDGFVDGDGLECPLHQGVVDISNGRIEVRLPG